MDLQPIVLRGVLHETIWGGQDLAKVAGKTLPANALVGESWETALDSVATNPPYVGMTLGAITTSLGVRLYGTRAQEICGDRFPLLAKFIDAHAWLSVQVHPDDAYAQTHERGKLGKTEAWRILSATPNAEIIHGFARPTYRAEVEEAIHATKLESLVTKVPVKTGDVVLNLAGTLHATGAGIVFYEIQEYSDVTYRLYDFGRVGADGKQRELHVEKSLDVVNYTPLARHIAVPISLDPDHFGQPATDGTLRLLVAARHFAMAEAHLSAGQRLESGTDGSSCHIISMIAGNALLSPSNGVGVSIPLPLGQTVVVPAEPTGYVLHSDAGARALISWVPDTGDESLTAWTAAQA